MMNEIVKDIESLIEKYQAQADLYAQREKELVCGGCGEVSQYTWAHSLLSVYRNFVSDLDDVLAKHE